MEKAKQLGSSIFGNPKPYLYSSALALLALVANRATLLSEDARAPEEVPQLLIQDIPYCDRETQRGFFLDQTEGLLDYSYNFQRMGSDDIRASLEETVKALIDSSGLSLESDRSMRTFKIPGYEVNILSRTEPLSKNPDPNDRVIEALFTTDPYYKDERCSLGAVAIKIDFDNENRGEIIELQIPNLTVNATQSQVDRIFPNENDLSVSNLDPTSVAQADLVLGAVIRFMGQGVEAKNPVIEPSPSSRDQLVTGS